MTMTAYLWCLVAVVKRDAARFVHQRARLLAALVRPLLWLVVFAAGFRSILGVSIIPPYETYITYEVYILPGLVGMCSFSTACSPRCRWSTTARWARCG